MWVKYIFTSNIFWFLIQETNKYIFTKNINIDKYKYKQIYFKIQIETNIFNFKDLFLFLIEETNKYIFTKIINIDKYKYKQIYLISKISSYFWFRRQTNIYLQKNVNICRQIQVQTNIFNCKNLFLSFISKISSYLLFQRPLLIFDSGDKRWDSTAAGGDQQLWLVQK